MKRIRLEDATVDQLVERFAEIGVAQDQAELMGEMGKFNRLFGQMKDPTASQCFCEAGGKVADPRFSIL
jgi:hypothetical protein